MLAIDRMKKIHVCSHVVGPGARFAFRPQNLHHHVDSMYQILIPIMSLLPNHEKKPNAADHEKNIVRRGLPF